MADAHKINLKAIQKTFQLLDDNFSELYTADGITDFEKSVLISARDAARDTFWSAASKQLEDNHMLVVQVREELTAANDELENMIEEMESISKTIDLIGQVVKLASSLATIAAG
jgi:DNA-binding transcriptional regulator YhcF (GntR family)